MNVDFSALPASDEPQDVSVAGPTPYKDLFYQTKKDIKGFVRSVQSFNKKSKGN